MDVVEIHGKTSNINLRKTTLATQQASALVYYHNIGLHIGNHFKHYNKMKQTTKFILIILLILEQTYSQPIPANDDRCNAEEITVSFPINYVIADATVIGASLDGPEMACGFYNEAEGVWYKIIIPNGNEITDACDCSSKSWMIETSISFDSKLAVWRSPSSCTDPLPGNCIAGNDDSGCCGGRSRVFFSGCFDELLILLHSWEDSDLAPTDITIVASCPTTTSTPTGLKRSVQLTQVSTQIQQIM